MESKAKYDSLQPRFLHYRNHYKIFLILLLVLSGLILSFWGHRITQDRWTIVYNQYLNELWISGAYFFAFINFYFFCLKSRLNRSIQIYPTHIKIHSGVLSEDVLFAEIKSVGFVYWSIFYFKMNNGKKHYFSSSLERIDYVWDGLQAARPDIASIEEFNTFRMKLVQYDHHQKRKEWFFRHKLIDILNWIVIPLSFLMITYFVQTREIIVHQHSVYLFRLFMYSMLVLLVTTFMYSFVLKKIVFDKRLKFQMHSSPDDKVRDVEFEGIVLRRSKILQTVTVTFIFSLVVHSEMNLFSLTKIREDLSVFNLKQGQTLVVDNRYNCLLCKYPVRDGDVMVFGQGTIGQIMATEGDMVGKISQDTTGRVIASEEIQEVPKGYVAIKLVNQNEILMVKVEDLIGKIQR